MTFQKGNKIWLGKRLSEATKQKIAAGRVGEANWQWKGDRAGYSALHKWVQRYFGKVGTCEFCGVKRVTEWANKTGKYLRDRADWLELCIKCHRKYDKFFKKRAKEKYPELGKVLARKKNKLE